MHQDPIHTHTHTHEDRIPGFPGTWASDRSGERKTRGKHVRRVDGVSVASETTDAFFFLFLLFSVVSRFSTHY